MDLANDIMAVWDARLAQQEGHGTFLRHLDGNLNNVDASNLEEIHPFDALAAEFHQLGWTVDWAVGLSEQQKEFVLANLWSFCANYADEEHQPDANSSAEVAALTAQADAAMERGEFDGAVAIYERARLARDRALFGPPPASKPKHGRRSASGAAPSPSKMHVSIVNSTPARRHQAEGAPSKREEVKARIAARDTAPGR